MYVLERRQELDILWETYYVGRPECIYMRALETCDRRTRQGEILEKRGKLQRRSHFRGMSVPVVNRKIKDEFLQSLRIVLDQLMDLRFVRVDDKRADDDYKRLLKEGKAEIVWGLHGQDLDRIESLDFVTPLLNLRYNFYIKRPEALAFESNFYFLPFNVHLYVALLVLFVLACACNALSHEDLQFSVDTELKQVRKKETHLSTGDREAMKEFWSMEDSLKYLMIHRENSSEAGDSKFPGFIVALDISGNDVPSSILAMEPPKELCRNEPSPLHALVEKFDAHVSSDMYILERRQELDILWETYYVDRPRCIYMRALETCDRRTRQGEILEKRGKLQRRFHFRGMNVTAMGLMDYEEFKYLLRKVLEESMDLRFVPVKNGDKVKSLIDRKAEIFWGSHGQTIERIGSIDFITPLENKGYNFYVMKPESQAFESGFYSKPFDVWVWSVLVMLIVLVCACNALIGKLNGGQGQSYLWSTVNAALLQGGTTESSDRRPSTRMVMAWTYTLGLLCLTSYTALLTSHLSVLRFRLPFQTLEELVELEGWKWAISLDGSLESYFRESDNPTFQKFIDPESGKVFDDKKVTDKPELEEKTAVLLPEERAQIWLKTFPEGKACSIVKIPYNVRNSPKGFLIRRGSPLRKFLNFQILKLRELGILDRLQRMKTVFDVSSTCADESIQLQSIGIYHVSFAFFFFLAGIFFTRHEDPCSLPAFRDGPPEIPKLLLISGYEEDHSDSKWRRHITIVPTGDRQVMKDFWSTEDSVRYLRALRGENSSEAFEFLPQESIVVLDISGDYVQNAVLSQEPPEEICANDRSPLHALAEKFDAHVSSDMYVLQRREELDILWETYYLQKPKCIYMRALETCDRRNRQSKILERRGKLQRRSHFRGMNVTIVGLVKEKFPQSIRKALEESMNLRFLLVNDSKDVVEFLLEGKAEIHWGFHGQSIERIGTVDFVTPLENRRYNFYIKRPKTMAFESDFYFRPFDRWVWSVVTTLIVLACACNALAGSLSGGQGLSYLWGTVCAALLQGGRTESSDTSPSTRMITIWTCTLSLLCLTSFTGLLTSQLSIPRFSLPFESVEELVELRSEGWKWALSQKDTMESFFQETKNQAFLEFLNNRTGRVFDETKVLQDGLQEKMVVLLQETKAKAWLEKLPPKEACSIVKIPYDVRKSAKGFLIRQGSPLRKFLNYQYLMYMCRLAP
ncbi:unnamed protein product [Darwinula stevensoni]|uniref:Ionotropic glutamate receptor C-terminal domain-containing protein n=1 Tax=Darwinula stevensoni TaxID=69355 RepID=A0A7R8WXT0_9CRUS|nr:unnamed protein product [Darwinula stevensoni]CAG0878679.1 unnamed protein product [Darwinula stevensoni]